MTLWGSYLRYLAWCRRRIPDGAISGPEKVAGFIVDVLITVAYLALLLLALGLYRAIAG
jgi:hypothetical protein